MNVIIIVPHDSLANGSVIVKPKKVNDVIRRKIF